MHLAFVWIIAIIAWLGGLLSTVMGYTLNQWNQGTLIEPHVQYYKIRGKIATAMLIYEDAIDAESENDRQNEASKALKELAGELLGVIEVLPKKSRTADQYMLVQNLVQLSTLMGTDHSDIYYSIKSDIDKKLGLTNVRDVYLKQLESKNA